MTSVHLSTPVTPAIAPPRPSCSCATAKRSSWPIRAWSVSIADPRSARELGVAPEAVTHIFLSHHHPDHTMNVALFPNAEVVDFWARYKDDLWLDMPGDGYRLSPRAQLWLTPGHTQEDASLIVEADDGVYAMTHCWWHADRSPEIDPSATTRTPSWRRGPHPGGRRRRHPGSRRRRSTWSARNRLLPAGVEGGPSTRRSSPEVHPMRLLAGAVLVLYLLPLQLHARAVCAVIAGPVVAPSAPLQPSPSRARGRSRGSRRPAGPGEGLRPGHRAGASMCSMLLESYPPHAAAAYGYGQIPGCRRRGPRQDDRARPRPGMWGWVRGRHVRGFDGGGAIALSEIRRRAVMLRRT